MILSASSNGEPLGQIEITDIRPSADRLLVKFKLSGYPEQHYMFSRKFTPLLWDLYGLDGGCDEDTAKALLFTERPAFYSVARVAWDLPALEVEPE
jgi:hypothetical protein